MQASPRIPSRLTFGHGWELLAPLTAILIGVGVVFVPYYIFGLLGSLFLVTLLAHGPLIRAAIVIAGGLTVFQISAGLSVEKFAYLGALIVATLFAAQSIASRWPSARELGGPPILVFTGIVALAVAISPLVALHSGFTFIAWALDIPAYGMLVIAVILGLDLAISNESPRRVATLLLLAGSVGAVGYMLYFAEQRGITAYGISRIVAVSAFLPAAAVCLALAYLFDGRHPYLMAVLAMLLIMATLFSGSRILILLVVPIVVTIGVARGRRFRVVALIVGAGFALAVLAGTVTLMSAAQSLNLDLLQTRLLGILPLLTSQDPSLDPSIFLRVLQTRALLEAWLQSPIFGAGPGGLYSYSYVVNDRPVDSPLAILARFGILGAGALSLLFAGLLTSRLRRQAYWVPATALLAFISLIAAWSLISSPLDDKGIALGLIPLIGLCGVWRAGATAN